MEGRAGAGETEGRGEPPLGRGATLEPREPWELARDDEPRDGETEAPREGDTEEPREPR